VHLLGFSGWLLSDSYVKRAHPHIPLIFFWFLVCTKFKIIVGYTNMLGYFNPNLVKYNLAVGFKIQPNS